MAVPLLDLVAQYDEIREAVRAAVDEVLETQRCIGGPKVVECEKAVAAYSECKYGIGGSPYPPRPSTRSRVAAQPTVVI